MFIIILTGGNSSEVERHLAKVDVAGSNPVSRSHDAVCAAGDLELKSGSPFIYTSTGRLTFDEGRNNALPAEISLRRGRVS